ncbi:hypothetical protein SMACR_05059 [Sordaria macrospora]|uniref:CBM1 domain-containing protein n=1 Tax=Sordaria macrospora TaxID=5147 RepID=A0A8S8ZYU6_SORMA|nr:hypothetical protein SMACR_05059 [Sordaria macrospora]
MLSPAQASALLVALGAAGVTAQTQNLWGQCGGIGWSGPTTCASGSYCFHQNDWYYQCIPGAGPTTAAPAQPTTTLISTTKAPTYSSSTAAAPSPTTSVPSAGGGGVCPNVPTSLGASVSTLPDPFTFAGGQKVINRADWTCRQAEIKALFEKYELGTLPAKPTVSASYSGSTLSITASTGGKLWPLPRHYQLRLLRCQHSRALRRRHHPLQQRRYRRPTRRLLARQGQILRPLRLLALRRRSHRLGLGRLPHHRRSRAHQIPNQHRPNPHRRNGLLAQRQGRLCSRRLRASHRPNPPPGVGSRRRRLLASRQLAELQRVQRARRQGNRRRKRLVFAQLQLLRQQRQPAAL